MVEETSLTDPKSTIRWQSWPYQDCIARHQMSPRGLPRPPAHIDGPHQPHPVVNFQATGCPHLPRERVWLHPPRAPQNIHHHNSSPGSLLLLCLVYPEQRQVHGRPDKENCPVDEWRSMEGRQSCSRSFHVHRPEQPWTWSFIYYQLVQRMEQIIGQALVRLISGPTYKEILRIIGGSEPSEEDYYCGYSAYGSCGSCSDTVRVDRRGAVAS